MPGSPPRMRGKAEHPSYFSSFFRITPAYAGKSASTACGCGSAGDHPRMCGEKLQVLDSIDLRSGSPPHVRGKVRRDAGDSGFVGITPACAGKSLSCGDARSQDWDHPRMCGEKAGKGMHHSPNRGSPPHVRGKGQIHVALVVVRGITPACAGKSAVLVRHAPPVQDHPRMCGEKYADKYDALPTLGSPPHVRGKD